MPQQFNQIKLFAGSASADLAQNIAIANGTPLGDLTLSKFSDGEIQPSFNESIRGCDLFLIQSTFAPSDNLMELLLMIDAAKRASAHYIIAVIPYFGLARQDRKDKPRVSIGSRLVANMLTVAGAHRVMTMDLHAAQIQGFFDIPVDHLDASVIFVPYIKSLNLPHLTIASPDMGGTSRARTFAKSLNVEVVICDKTRKRANEIESMNIIGEVEGLDIVLVDDKQQEEILAGRNIKIRKKLKSAESPQTSPRHRGGKSVALQPPPAHPGKVEPQKLHHARQHTTPTDRQKQKKSEQPWRIRTSHLGNRGEKF